MKYLISIFRILTAKKWVVVTLEDKGDGRYMEALWSNISAYELKIVVVMLRQISEINAAQCSAVDEVNEILKSKSNL